jgi:Fe2+ or Zn2+ uptake regulation protein
VKADLYQVEKSELVYEILTYLAEHPDSNDTIEGIVQWWLLERRIEYAIAKVKDALAELVAQGLVLENEGKDSRVHYRINRHKRGEIQALLKKQRSGGMHFG